MLVLEGAQAGLSWITILRKREAYRRAFDGFDPEKMRAAASQSPPASAQNPSIVRNRLKIRGRRSQRAGDVLGDCATARRRRRCIWQFVGGRPKLNRWTRMGQVPPRTPESDAMSRALKQRGFTFCRLDDLLRVHAGDRGW